MKTSAVVSVRGSEAFTKAVQAQLDKILASEFFRNSARHQLLLQRIVAESLAGRGDALKEIALANDVFERPEYDPKRHTLVRVEANAIRRKLVEYYAKTGSADKIQIDIPVGHYAATFSYLPSKHARARRTRYCVLAACAAALLLVIFTVVANWPSHPPPPGVPVQITFDTGWTAQPAISGDGSVLVYSSDRGPRGNADIWIQQPGRPLRQLTDDPANDITPDISPDGKRVVFRSWRKDEGIWSISAQGGEPKLLAKGGYAPRFSPDGKQIAFADVANDEVGHVFTIPAGGGVPEQLDYGTTDTQCPVWSSDGTRVVFAARDTSASNYDLWTARATGARNEPSRPLGIQAQLRAQNFPSKSMCPQDWVEGRRIPILAEPAFSRSHRQQDRFCPRAKFAIVGNSPEHR